MLQDIDRNVWHGYSLALHLGRARNHGNKHVRGAAVFALWSRWTHIIARRKFRLRAITGSDSVPHSAPRSASVRPWRMFNCCVHKQLLKWRCLFRGRVACIDRWSLSMNVSPVLISFFFTSFQSSVGVYLRMINSNGFTNTCLKSNPNIVRSCAKYCWRKMKLSHTLTVL